MMKHYVDTNKQIWGFAKDGSQDHLITPDMRPLSDEELTEMQKPTQEQIKQTANAKIQLQIEELEKQAHRPLRELQLDSTNTFAKTKLAEIDAKITELRGQLING